MIPFIPLFGPYEREWVFAFSPLPFIYVCWCRIASTDGKIILIEVCDFRLKVVSGTLTRLLSSGDLAFYQLHRMLIGQAEKIDTAA
jgi:hypothetical protein